MHQILRIERNLNENTLSRDRARWSMVTDPWDIGARKGVSICTTLIARMTPYDGNHMQIPPSTIRAVVWFMCHCQLAIPVVNRRRKTGSRKDAMSYVAFHFFTPACTYTVRVLVREVMMYWGRYHSQLPIVVRRPIAAPWQENNRGSRMMGCWQQPI